MYTPLSNNRTKEHYQKIVDETLLISEERLKKEQLLLWNSIVNQLQDIKLMIIGKQAFSDWEGIYDRYTLGTIAVREFTEGDEMQARLCDIFWGAVHYSELKEKGD